MDKFDKNKQQQAPSQTPTDKNKYGTQQEQHPKQDQSGKRVDENVTDRNKVGAPGQGQR